MSFELPPLGEMGIVLPFYFPLFTFGHYLYHMLFLRIYSMPSQELGEGVYFYLVF